jgi:hypothetical protein
MTEFQELKEKQLGYLENVKKFKAIVSTMEKSKIDLLEKSLKNSSYLIEAEGLEKQLQNPNISLSVVAEVSNGKSTFLNALIFKDQVLHSGLGAVTARLFKIDYGKTYTLNTNDSTTSYVDIESLKDAVKKLNVDTREKMDKHKEVDDSDVKEVNITLPHDSLKDGITIYDTPGFGALDESLVYPIIQTSVAKSDAVIMLLDVAQGIKKGEDKFVKDVLKSIPADKRFVIFNKIDAVINEDQKMLMGEDELKEQLAKVKNDTLKQLSSITDIPQDQIVNYSLSASKALVGFKQKDQEKIDDSNFETFETDFWHKVVNSKREVFENRIVTYNKLIENCSKNVGLVKDNLEKNQTELKNLQNALIERKAVFSAFSKQSIDALDENIQSFSMGTSTVFSVEGLLQDIQKIMEDEIYDALDEINWIDKLKVWSLKDKYITQIETALEDSDYEIRQSVNDYMGNLIKELHSAQTGINSTIDSINQKIKEFSDLGVIPLDNIEILVKNDKGEYGLNSDTDFSDLVSLDKELFVIIGGIVAEIIAGRLLLLIPGLGLAIGAAMAAIMKIWKTYSDPNRGLASKISLMVVEELKNELTVELDNYTSQTNEIKNAMSLSLLSAKAKLQMIEKSFENPEEREQELAQLKQDINTLDSYQTQLNTLKGNK